jgi:ferredoxin--NADP+ reductase
MSMPTGPGPSRILPPRPLPGTRVLPPRLAGRPLASSPVGARVRATLEPNATIVGRMEVSPTVARFVVRADASPGPFSAGQYLALGLWIDGRLVQRPYSSAQGPGAADTHEFLVRLVPGGALTPSLWEARVGSRVWLGRPKGEFVLDESDGRAHVFVASGTGLAPFIAMSRALALRGDPPRTVLVHGVTTPADLAFGAELEGLSRDGLRLVFEPTVSRPADPASAGWRGRLGRAEASLPGVLADHDLRPGDAVAYLCGNPGMVAAAEAALAAAGFPAADVRAERYWVAAGAGAAA